MILESLEQSVYVDDLKGKKFYNMEVISFAGINDKGRSTWLCRCDCGNEKIVVGSELKRGKVKSCGCRNTTINGLYQDRLYRIHHLMICRCYTKSTTSYERYGGRGITVCDEWRNKENGFLNFYKWSMENGYSENLTIDRIDNDGNYEPANCRWVDRMEQANNTSRNVYIEYQGLKKTISEWSRYLGIDRRTLDKRLRKGWGIEKAFSKPVNINCRTRKPKHWRPVDMRQEFFGTN